MPFASRALACARFYRIEIDARGTCATAPGFKITDVTDQNISLALASVVGYAFLAATELIASI